jgi:hypothetical protein
MWKINNKKFFKNIKNYLCHFHTPVFFLYWHFHALSLQFVFVSKCTLFLTALSVPFAKWYFSSSHFTIFDTYCIFHFFGKNDTTFAATEYLLQKDTNFDADKIPSYRIMMFGFDLVLFGIIYSNYKLDSLSSFLLHFPFHSQSNPNFIRVSSSVHRLSIFYNIALFGFVTDKRSLQVLHKCYFSIISFAVARCRCANFSIFSKISTP